MSIESGKVNVFPTALRTQAGTGKFTSENNITGIVRAIAHSSYIVSYPKGEGNLLTGDWEFVIYGYYFKTNGLGITSTSSGEVYASITLDGSGRLINPEQGKSSILDENDQFKGLTILTTNPGPDTDTVHNLQLVNSNSVCHNSLYEIEAEKIQVNIGSGSDDLQSRMDNISTYIGEPYPISTKGDINSRVGSLETHVGSYNDSKGTISDRLDDDDTLISSHTSGITAVNSRVSNECVLLDNPLETNSMESSITFKAKDSTTQGDEYNNLGINFSTGNTGIGARQEGTSGSVIGIRAENGINIGIGSTAVTKLGIANNRITTSTDIYPSSNEQLDLGSDNQKFRNIYGNNFTGNSATATESTKLGHTQIGQPAEAIGQVVTSKTMYIDGTGAPQTGITITFSDDNPSGGHNGDIWFKYNA